MKNINSNSFLNLIKSNLNLLLKIGGVSLLAAASQTLITPSAFAGTNLTSKETFEGKVNYTVTGGTLRNRSNSDNACSLNSTSSAQLSGIPANANIRKAYLYYGGNGSTVDSQIKLDGASLTVDRSYTDRFSLNNVDYDFFQGVKDVTSLVAAKKNGTYQLSDLSVSNEKKYCDFSVVLSGWSLVVVYNDPAIPSDKLNKIQLYEGFKASRNDSVNYTLGNIKVASNPIAKFSMLLWEGDDTLGGTNEFFKFNNNLLTDQYNPAENQFNSSINTLQSTTTYGVDLDTFDVSNKVSANATSVTGTVSTNNDLVLQGAALMMVTDQLAVQPNQAPNALADTTPTPYGTAVDINVLANDSDPEGQALTILSVTNPTGGTTQIVNGKVKYTPNANFNTAGGSDTFSYTVKDPQGATGTANVTVSVGARNGEPNAVADTSSTPYGEVVDINVLANDSDPEGQALTIDSVTTPSGGTTQIVNGKVRYTPSANFNTAGGSDTFSYTVKDPQGATGTANVTVSVAAKNAAPIANNDSARTEVNRSVTIDVLANDTDAEGDRLSLGNVSNVRGGTAAILNNRIVYTAGSTPGTYSLNYTVSDGRSTSTGTATIVVTPLSD